MKQREIRRCLTLGQAIVMAVLLATGTGEQSAVAAETLQLSELFGSHMVIQRVDRPIRIWGMAATGGDVQLQFAGHTAQGSVDDQGQFELTLPAVPAGGPFELAVTSGQETVRLVDVSVGDVWLCSGQSNMDFPLSQDREWSQLRDEAPLPQLRLFDMRCVAHPGGGHFTDGQLQYLRNGAYFTKGPWQVGRARTAAAFSAVAFYFGSKLQRELGVPIGLIHNAVGGSPTEAWVSDETLGSRPELAGLLAEDWYANEQVMPWCRQRAAENLGGVAGGLKGQPHPFHPGYLFRTGIQPLQRIPIRGVIWYQGESNAPVPEVEFEFSPAFYEQLFRALVADWRRHWQNPRLPFFYVQLPAMGRDWPEFREVQRICQEIPDTGMAVTIDTGHPTNVHPRDKRPVGERLADLALHDVFGRDVVARPPQPLRAVRDGSSVRLDFDITRDGGLVATDQAATPGFELAGPDGVFHPAQAAVSETNVLLQSEAVPSPAAVRYAWAPVPRVNLSSRAGLPVGPFLVAVPHPKRSSEEPLNPNRRHSSQPDPTRDTLKQPQQMPNVLLIVSEDNGAELSCYGAPDVRTPHLDRLARQGCRFANAYVTHAVCSASRASFLTGLYPFQNGQIGLATHRYAMFRKWDNIPSILKAHGYRTGLIGKLHVNPESAFPFDFRWNEAKANSFGSRNVRRVAEVAGEFFRDTAQPFFLSVNFSDAHFPVMRQQNGLPPHPLSGQEIQAPLPFIGADSPRLRQGTADYYNCLMRLDTGIGLLLEELGKAGRDDNTLVIYIGDHGAQFSRGKATCYEGGLRIPMIVRWPGQLKAGIVRDELVSTVDILPTILQATSLPARSSLPGRSLLPLASDRNVAWRKYLFAERTAYHSGSFYPQRALRGQRYKIILNLTPDRPNPVAETYGEQSGAFFTYGTTREEIASAPEPVRQAYATWRNPPVVELYDLRNDPWEFHDLSDHPELSDVRQRLLDELQRFREKHGDPLLDREKLKRLAAEHEHVATNVPGGRYGRNTSWRYLSYLRDAP